MSWILSAITGKSQLRGKLVELPLSLKKEKQINSRAVRLQKLGQTFVFRMVVSSTKDRHKMNCALRRTTFCKTRLELHTMEEDSSKRKMEQTEKRLTKFVQTDDAPLTRKR